MRENRQSRAHQKRASKARDPFDPLKQMITQNPRMLQIFDLVRNIADTNSTLLMTGPSGTGKSMLAKAIHNCSLRSKEPFVEVSCGALTETLLESELFGHVKGAFTGAIANKPGKFFVAHKGTIFLDEIAAASMSLQLKLLRILEDRQFEPVGSVKTKTIDTRILLATNGDLVKEIHAGRFREDLFYRISVINIDLPPLCQRQEDIPLLVNHFITHYNKQHSRHKTGVSSKAMTVLKHYAWPGNIRELENVIERAILLAPHATIDRHDLPDTLLKPHPANIPVISLQQARLEPEKAFIRNGLQDHGFNRTHTAKAMGINRSTLYKKMKQYGLDIEIYRAKYRPGKRSLK